MAHVEKRGTGRWRARYRGPDGRERSQTFTRRADAERWLAGVELSKARGEWVDAKLGQVRFAEFAAAWFETKADVAPRTRINIEGRLANHVVPFFGDMPMAAIRPTHVRSWVAGLVAQELAPSTVKATYLTASQVFAQAVVDGIIGRTPCVGVVLPRDRQHAEVHFLDPGQVNELAAAIDDRYRPLIYTAAYGGLRAGELTALRVERLHLLDQTLDVVESMSEVRGKLVIGPTKTGKPRSIPLPRFLAQMLGEHVGRYPSEDGFVFTAREGGPVRHRNFYRRHFRPAVTTAGLPEALRFHDLRHSCAALLIANGRHMEEVKDHLGHSSIRVTSDRYGHLFPKAKRDLADGLDATFAQILAALPRPEGSVHQLSRAYSEARNVL
jgi:integrase